MSGHPTEALEAGTEAPDFELKATPDQSVSLAEFRGRPKSQIHVRKRLLAAIAALMAAFAFGMAYYDALSSIQDTFMLYTLLTFDSVAWRRQRGATSRAV